MPEDVEEKATLDLVRQVTEVQTSMGHIQGDVAEIKNDVKEIVRGSPLYRIEKLEGRWKGLFTWLGLLTVTLVGIGLKWMLEML